MKKKELLTRQDLEAILAEKDYVTKDFLRQELDSRFEAFHKLIAAEWSSILRDFMQLFDQRMAEHERSMAAYERDMRAIGLRTRRTDNRLVSVEAKLEEVSEVLK